MSLKEQIRKLLSDRLTKSAYKRAGVILYGKVFIESNVAFQQFFSWKHPLTGLWYSLKALASAGSRIFQGRSTHYSFSYTGEDRILEGLIKPKTGEKGFYVDVGCNHPEFLSNTFLFYRLGWRGICIDANKDLVKKYKYRRPKDTAICALISDSTEKRTYYIAENDVLSTTEPGNLEEIARQKIEVKQTEVQPVSLTKILDQYNAPADFNLLSVDAEEHDLNVLKSLSWQKYRPKFVVVEDETFVPESPANNPVFNFLTNKGYQLKGYILKNLYFEKVDK